MCSSYAERPPQYYAAEYAIPTRAQRTSILSSNPSLDLNVLMSWLGRHGVPPLLRCKAASQSC